MPKSTASRQNGQSTANQQLPWFLTSNRGTPKLVCNDTTLSRAVLIAMAGGSLPAIDIDTECRYPKALELRHFREMYDRVGIATRSVSVYPDEAWQMSPDIYETEDLDKETEFEKAWDVMNTNLNIITHLQTADEYSGIGRFGGLLLGFDGGDDLSKPVLGADGTKRDGRFANRQLMYVRAMSESELEVKSFESSVTSPRYGKPLLYKVPVVDLSSSGTGLKGEVPQTRDQVVHWSRVIHISDKGNTFAPSRLQNIYNHLWDIRKILGANGQGYWQSGFPGLSVETQPGIENPQIDIEAVKKDVQNYILGLQRALALDSMHSNVMKTEIADPKSHFETHLSAICITIKVPLRVFKGTEEAKLASGQDMRTWNKRLASYQERQITSFILRPFFERMFLVGALPRPKQLLIKWPDLNAPTENDRATTAFKLTEALVNYVSGNVFLVMPPKEYLTLVIGLSLAQVNSILSSAGGKKIMDKLNKLAAVAMQPKPTPGTVGAKKTPAGKSRKPPAVAGAGQPG